MLIKELSKSEYMGYPLDFSYTTDYYFDVIVQKNQDIVTITLVKTLFDEPVVKSFDGHLFEPFYEHALAWGIFDEDILCGVIEINHEHWNQRLRITELLVNPEYRRQGIGQRLMKQVKDYFYQSDFRALVLETQSCNAPAISFYQREGFDLIGFDAICYTNHDQANKEVRLEFGITK